MQKRIAHVEQSACVACGSCLSQCPRNAIEVWKGMYAKIDTSLCVGCGKCVQICPASIIELQEVSAHV